MIAQRHLGQSFLNVVKNIQSCLPRDGWSGEEHQVQPASWRMIRWKTSCLACLTTDEISLAAIFLAVACRWPSMPHQCLLIYSSRSSTDGSYVSNSWKVSSSCRLAQRYCITSTIYDFSFRLACLWVILIIYGIIIYCCNLLLFGPAFCWKRT